MNAVCYWNKVSLDLVAADFTPDDPKGPPSVPPKPNRGGPTGTSYALAMIHLGMSEVVARLGAAPFTSYFSTILPAAAIPLPVAGAAVNAAVNAVAATLCRAMYPAQGVAVDAAQAKFASTMLGSLTVQAIIDGEDYGRRVALAFLAARQGDKSDIKDPYVPSMAPGKHRVDPHHTGQGYHGAYWGKVRPFACKPVDNSNYQIAPEPVGSPVYKKAYNGTGANDFGVYELGRVDSTTRTPEQTEIGIFWSYDGSAKLGTPPRLYNQIAAQISDDRSNTLEKDAQMFGIINAGMADAGIAAWHYKYVHEFWRPVIGIREADVGTGPTGLGDGWVLPGGKPHGDPGWCPLGAQDTNGGMTKNFTPNFPAFPSGHATFGSACFNLLRLFYNKTKLKDITVTISSDEYNADNRDSTGVVRPRVTRRLNLDEANDENIKSRVYLGVHWLFDGTRGDELGGKIAKDVYAALK